MLAFAANGRHTPMQKIGVGTHRMKQALDPTLQFPV